MSKSCMKYSDQLLPARCQEDLQPAQASSSARTAKNAHYKISDTKRMGLYWRSKKQKNSEHPYKTRKLLFEKKFRKKAFFRFTN